MPVVEQKICASCGNQLVPDGEFCLFCGDIIQRGAVAPPAASLVRPDAAVSEPPPPLEYAGFWRRVWAGSIDIVIEALAALIITVMVDLVMKLVSPQFGLSPITARYFTGMVFIAVLTLGSWFYCAFSESSRWRATVGKRIIGLQVLTASGDRLNFGQATVRHFMKFLSLFTLAFGFMMAGWTRRRQALHDMPQDCIVVRVAEPSLSLLGLRHS